MPEIGNTAVFAQVDANNNTGTQPSWAEGMSPSSVNDAARALQGAITREWNWRNPTLTTTGSANAYVLTFSVAPAALYNGQTFAFLTNFANTGSATLNINSLGAKTIKKVVAGIKTALASGDLASGALVAVAYNSGDDSFLILSPTIGAVAAGDNIAFTGANTHAGTETFNSTATFNNTVTIAKELALSGDITPAQITASQNDYAPTGHATASIFRLDTNNFWNITGLQGGSDGRIVVIFNVGSNVIGIPHDSASSSAANRFYIPDSVSDAFELLPNCTAILVYDSSAAASVGRWRLSPLPSPATAARMETGTSYGCYATPMYQHRHPGHPKFWAFVTVSAGTPTLQTSYNVTSITDTATGRLTVTIATDFSSANWGCHAFLQSTASGPWYIYESNGGKAAGTIEVSAFLNGTGLADPNSWSVSGLGDHA